MERSGGVAMAVTFTGFLVLCFTGFTVASPVRSGPSRIVREARPQFVFGGGGIFPSGPGIGVQTPIAGAHLGLTSGLTVNAGRQPAAVQPEQQQKQQQQQQQEQPPQVPVELPASVESAPAAVPAKEEGLGTRIDGEEAPATTEILEDHPCYNYDPSQATQDAPSDGTTTEHPCAGVGAGNKINPKQAALLSLVG